MTNIQVIQHLIGDSAIVSDERLLIACQLLELDPNATYDPKNTKVKCLVYKVAITEILRTKGVKRESEGGYTKEYVEGMAPEALALAYQSECDDLIAFVTGQPIIRNISNMW